MQSQHQDTCFNFFSEEIPDEIKLAIIHQVAELKDFVRLREVCKELNRLVFSSKLSYGFFSLFVNYQLREDVKQYILSPDKVTASDVRAGNRLVSEAIDCFKQGEMRNAGILLKKAMHRYGSYHAMAFIKFLSTLPGRRGLNFDIDELIRQYTKQAELALLSEYKSHFPPEEHWRCAANIQKIEGDFVTHMQSMWNAIKELYEEDKGVSTANAYKFAHKVSAGLGVSSVKVNYGGKSITVSYFKKFDPEGFLGVKPPKKDWYLQTESHKQFMKREKILDALPTTPTITKQLI